MYRIIHSHHYYTYCFTIIIIIIHRWSGPGWKLYYIFLYIFSLLCVCNKFYLFSCSLQKIKGLNAHLGCLFPPLNFVMVSITVPVVTMRQPRFARVSWCCIWYDLTPPRTIYRFTLIWQQISVLSHTMEDAPTPECVSHQNLIPFADLAFQALFLTPLTLVVIVWVSIRGIPSVRLYYLHAWVFAQVYTVGPA